MRPVRVGLRRMLSSTTSLSRVIRAATRGKAAELGSPGTAIAVAASSRSPVTVMRRWPSAAVAMSSVAPKPAQHALGVVAGGDRLDDRGGAGGVEAGQQDGRLDLGRGHRQLVYDGYRVAGAGEGEGQAAAPGAVEACSHALERGDDPAHRPLAQRGVAGQAGDHRRGGDQAGGEPGAGAGIAEVDRVVGRAKAANADAADMPAAVAPALDRGAERGHGAGGVDHVLGFEKAGNGGLADGERPQHQGAVGDRLVARDRGAAMEAGRGAGSERFRHGRGWVAERWIKWWIAGRSS